MPTIGASKIDTDNKILHLQNDDEMSLPVNDTLDECSPPEIFQNLLTVMDTVTSPR